MPMLSRRGAAAPGVIALLSSASSLHAQLGDAATTPPEIRFGTVAPAKPAGSFRLATYNIENLFDAADDPALTGENEDKDNAKPESQLKGAAAAIRALDADVLALEEIESEQALLWFRETYLKDLGYDYHASIDAGDARGIEQAVLSRFPITGVKNWAHAALNGTHPADAPDAEPHAPLTFHRSPLLVDLEIPASKTGGQAYRFSLFVVHHKSGAKSAYWREAESVKALELVKQAEADRPGRNIAVLGDFNAQPNQPTYQTYITGGLIDTLAARAAPGAKDSPKFITHESGRTIDYIVVNANLQAEVIASSAFVLGTPARPAGVDWKTHPAPEGYASDHYPVAVDVRFTEGNATADATPGSGASTSVKER